MAVKISDFSPHQAVEDVQRTLATISPGAGYNTRPVIMHAPIDSTNVKGTALPALYVQLVAYEGQSQVVGGYSSFTENGLVHLVVFGYVREVGDKKAALMSLFCDVIECLWADGTRGGHAVMTHVGLVEFMETFLNQQNVAMMAVPISVQTQISRGEG